MAYITNLDEVVPLLRGKLREYLSLKLGVRANARKFKCFVHEEETPSMIFNPKTNDETVHCFGCGATLDIFAAAHAIEGLPSEGQEWITSTIPHLCTALEIPIKIGEPTATDKKRHEQYKLAQDIADILAAQTNEHEYIKERGWQQDDLIVASIDEDVLMGHLATLNWNAGDLKRSLLLRTKHQTYFGPDKITFVVKDFRGRPIGFVTRNLEGVYKDKYINSIDSEIYEKHKVLLGLDVAAKNKAKTDGVYIVEGPGDLVQLYKAGVKNAVATCGTAFTASHMASLRVLGIRKIFFCFDWDSPGSIATQRALENEIRAAVGTSIYVIVAPRDSTAKDPDEYLSAAGGEAFLALPKVPAFDWLIAMATEHESPYAVCERMISIIATESAAVRREALIKTLSEYTGITHQAIGADVNAIRSEKFSKRREQLRAATEQYLEEVRQDPDSITTLMAQHEQQIENIEKTYQRDIIGVNYQINRFEAIQEGRLNQPEDSAATSFRMKYFPDFMNAMNGGAPWAISCLMMAGGRANSGKTATVLAIGADVALSDEDAIVLIHSTDDSYEQIEPRLKSNLYHMANPTGPKLTIGMIVQPSVYLPQTDIFTEAHNQATDLFRKLINDEKIVLIDSEDGPFLSVLEKHLRYYRARYPNKKILMVCDKKLSTLWATIKIATLKLLETPKALLATTQLERVIVNA